MKRRLFYFLAFLFCWGSINAQDNHYQFDPHGFDFSWSTIAQININGVEQTSSDFEIGAFNGDIVTGSERIDVYGTAGYHRVFLSVFFDTPYEVTFKLYNHDTGRELTNFEVTYEGEPYTFVFADGELYGSNKRPVVINFITTESFDLPIAAYTENGGYYLISSPIGQVSPGAVTNMIPTSGGYDLFYFDQTKENEWINYKEGENSTNPGFNLEPGKGYLYAREVGETLTFTGTAYSGDGTFDLVYSTTNSDPSMHGWNLVGNPFGTSATPDQPYYRLNSDGSEVNADTEEDAVACMEGVFVKATGENQSVTFTPGSSKESSKIDINVLKDRGATIDRAIVRFNEGGQLPKFMLNPENTKIYIPQNGDQYAVVSGGNENSLPVNFKAKENGTYTLNIEVENVDMDYLHLIDHKTGDDVDLLVNPNYTFQARSTDYAERFTLVYANTTGLEENFAFFNGSKWVIGNEGKATLQIMDVVGRMLSSEQINGSTEVSLGQPAGVYVMRLINGDNVKTQKVVVR